MLATGPHWAAKENGKRGRLGELGRKEEMGREVRPARLLGRELSRAQEKVNGGWAGSRVSWVLVHYRVGTRKILFLFNSFYNL
jgi:hypothetical protein